MIDVLKESKLAGRGGAGFPTGMKWQFVREAPGEPKSIVCNADEGEPGCFKDRALMDHDPFAVIEGMTLAGYATGADRGFLYLRYEYPETNARLESAIAAAEAAGLLGENILGSGFTFRLYLRRGAGAYICGEEGSLLNSLEGKHPFPRNRPPYPTTNGFDDLPTAVNNVETLCAVPQILRRGAEWYQGLGLADHAGTKVISLSGMCSVPATMRCLSACRCGRCYTIGPAGRCLDGHFRPRRWPGCRADSWRARRWSRSRWTNPASEERERCWARAA